MEQLNKKATPREPISRSRNARIVKEYQTPIDSRKRITIRGNAAEYYNVKQYENGVIVMEPRKLVRPDSISEKSLEMIYESIQNLQEGNVSDDFNLEEAVALFEDPDE